MLQLQRLVHSKSNGEGGEINNFNELWRHEEEEERKRKKETERKKKMMKKKRDGGGGGGGGVRQLQNAYQAVFSS